MAAQNGLASEPHSEVVDEAKQFDGADLLHNVKSMIKPSALLRAAKSFIPGGSFIPDWVIDSGMKMLERHLESDPIPSSSTRAYYVGVAKQQLLQLSGWWSDIQG
jgi:hypothetical protein